MPLMPILPKISAAPLGGIALLAAQPGLAAWKISAPRAFAAAIA